MGIPRFCGFRDFSDSEISRNFEIPCRSRALPRQRHAAEEGKRGARRAAVCLECVSARPLRGKFGKIENLRFRKFGSEIWAVFALPLSCVQSSPMSGTLRFSHNSTRIIAFRVPDKRETGPEDARWPRGPLPMVPAVTTTTAPLQTSKIIKNHQTSPKITKNAAKPVLKISDASKI